MRLGGASKKQVAEKPVSRDDVSAKAKQSASPTPQTITPGPEAIPPTNNEPFVVSGDIVPIIDSVSSNPAPLPKGGSAENDPVAEVSNAIGKDFSEVDRLIEIGQMGGQQEEAPIPKVADSEELPIAEAFNPDPVEIEDLVLVEDLVVTEDSDPVVLDEEGQSFEVLEDSDEDVIELSDGDIVVGQQPPGNPVGADIQNLPLPPVDPIVVERVIEPRGSGSVEQPVANPVLPASGSSTPTSMNPAYRVFGPPPPAHYPHEPPIPDGATANAAGAAVANAGRGSFASNQAGVSVEAIFALITGFLAIIVGLWVSFGSYHVVNGFTPGTAFSSFGLTGQAGIISVIYGFRLLAGLGILVGACLFFANEIMRVNGSNPMPYSNLIAMIAACFLLLAEFTVACYGVFNLTAMTAYGINVGGSVFVILLFTLLRSLIPVALIVFAALRQR